MTHRERNLVLGVLPRVEADLGVRREMHGLHRHRVRVRGDVVRQYQDRRLAVAHEIARHGEDEIGGGAGKLFQGKCRLISHTLKEVKYRGIGSFGLSNEKPIRDEALIPDRYSRTENGTDIYILGLRGHKHWKEEMTEQIIHHFWRAIQKGDLDVEIDGQIINSGNIESKMFEVFKSKDFNKKNEQNPIPYY